MVVLADALKWNGRVVIGGRAVIENKKCNFYY
jgi:hypothetical protein